MSHSRITATADGRTFVGRQIEIRSDERAEVALAAAWANVLGTPCLAREVAAEETPPEGCVTLHACDGPRIPPGDSQAGKAAYKGRTVGRFEVVTRRADAGRVVAARPQQRGHHGRLVPPEQAPPAPLVRQATMQAGGPWLR